MRKKKTRLVEIKDKDGNTKKKDRNPLDRMSSEYLHNAMKIASDLGLTPVSSMKLKLPTGNKINDELQEFFKNFD